jgi:16S rRNA (guanine527-N7)-methyltransferase
MKNYLRPYGYPPESRCVTMPEDPSRTSADHEARLPQLSPEHRSLLTDLRDLLLEANTRVNLTAVRDASAVEKLHFEDSLAALAAEPALATAQAAADLGCGAGFPLFPLAIALPGCRWIGIESVGKKCAFIQETAVKLGLRNVEALNGRAEDFGKHQGGSLRGQLDIVTARAVGPVAALCECGLPLLQPNGTLLLFKTESALKELDGAESSLADLGGSVLPEFRYRLAGDEQDRVILRIRKTGTGSDRYPRPAGVPFKKPLFG